MTETRYYIKVEKSSSGDVSLPERTIDDRYYEGGDSFMDEIIWQQLKAVKNMVPRGDSDKITLEFKAKRLH